MNNFWKKLNKPFIALAPMENVTDYVFRETIARYLPKPDVMFTEFTNVEALNSDGFKKTIHRFNFSQKQKPIVAQIWGMKPENYFNVSKLVSDLGFDGLDINMGCPDKTVVKIGACSALIDNKNLAREIIMAAKEGAKKIPISIKTRIGIKKVVTEEWISFLLEQKLEALTIHGRTAKQMSNIPADWKEIEKAVKLRADISPETMIIGNGDIKSYQEGVEKSKEYNLDGVMIARGILSNPFVFEKSKSNHSLDDVKNVLKKHLEIYQKVYGSTREYDRMKKFFKMYMNGFKNASEIRSDFMKTKSVEDALTMLK